MKLGAGLLIAFVAQALTPSPQQLASVRRPLQPPEIDFILRESRAAIANQTFTLSFPGHEGGPQVLMRADGRPKRMRSAYGMAGGLVGSAGTRTDWHDEFIDVVDYTGAPAVRCDGSAITGELVITYEHRESKNEWTARAATTAVDWKGPVEIGGPIFNILSGATPVSSGVVREGADGRVTRPFSAPFSTPPHSARGAYGLGDPPTAATQVLWIDGGSLLPVRWEVVVADAVRYELVFNYKSLDLKVPEGIAPPRCIP